MMVHLACIDDFRSLARRHFLRSMRDAQPWSALTLQAVFDHGEPGVELDAASRLPLLTDSAGRLRARVRSVDTAALWQGRFFGVLLPRCDSLQATAVLTRLQRFCGCSSRLRGAPLVLSLQGQVLEAKDL
jgi:hypothetical protein